MHYSSLISTHIDSESDLHWLFIYFVLLMSLWHSFFAFFRYYSTAFIATLVYYFALRLQSLLHLEILSFAHRIVQTKHRVAVAWNPQQNVEWSVFDASHTINQLRTVHSLCRDCFNVCVRFVDCNGLYPHFVVRLLRVIYAKLCEKQTLSPSHIIRSLPMFEILAFWLLCLTH